MAMLVASTVIVSACSPVKPMPVIRTEVVRPVVPDGARQPCAAPFALPDRAMNARDVTAGWSADRTSLLTCEQRRAAAVAAIDGAAP